MQSIETDECGAFILKKERLNTCRGSGVCVLTTHISQHIITHNYRLVSEICRRYYAQMEALGSTEKSNGIPSYNLRFSMCKSTRVFKSQTVSEIQRSHNAASAMN